jgi:hypothetical protein
VSYDCSCDYDPPEFYQATRPKARKAFQCYECSGAILPGERYERVVGKWSGYFDFYLTCERCHDIRQWVQNNVPCFCWAHGNLNEDARHAVEEASYRAPEETKGLIFGFMRRLVRRNQHNRALRAGRPLP